MTKLLPLLLLLIFCTQTKAQSPVTGTIKDTSEKKNLANGVVTLLKKDSVLYRFTRTDRTGSFGFDNVPAGDYILLITFPKFADYAEPLQVKSAAIELGDIALTQKAQLLQAVVIKSGSAIRIKGDTTEFAADSFKVREGATVEELLKKLPGFQVNSKGEITAQGQRVQKVLVDGEEFFGDDPTMATKNISARAVDKVQVFDTKTDQQQLTGATTGQEGKTVNIKLKEDQKKGGFGKYSAASDFSKYHELNALYNRFVGKKKMSVYANKTNLSSGSLNWEDKRKLGLEDDYEFDEVSGYYNSFGDGDGTIDYLGSYGLPDAYAVGGLFSNKWAADKQSINGSYRYNRLLSKNIETTNTQNILADRILYTNEYSKSKNKIQQHAVTGKWEWKPDSLSTLKFVVAANRRNSVSESSNSTETLSDKGAYLNTGISQGQSSARNTKLDNSLQYTRLFKKQGRQLIARLRFNYVENTDSALRTYTNKFYKQNVIDSVDVADQLRLNFGHSNTLGTKLTYVEPLSKKWALIADYSYNLNNAISNHNTYDKSNGGKYELLNKRYSNNFTMEAISQTGSLLTRYNTKKLRFSFGSGLSVVRLNLDNKDSNKQNVYHFQNLTPQANINYTLKQNNSINFRYSGNSVQLSINELQPLRNNSDPLDIFIGNPDLKVGFRHNLNLSYNLYKVLSQTGLWTSVNYSATQNAIDYSTTIDSSGRKVSQSVNVNGNRDWNLYGNFFKGGGQKKVHPSVGLNARGGRNVNFVNGLQNTTNYYNGEVSIGGSYEVDDKWNINIRPKLGYSNSVSSLNKSATTSYLYYGGEAEGLVNLPGKLELSSDVNLDLRQRISAFNGNANITLWNAELNRKFLKKKSLKLGLVAHDILNTYKGFERTATSNFIIEKRYQRVGQYFLLKLEWTFNKMGGGDE